MLFLQETNSNSKIEQNWKEDFTGQVFTSHGKTRKVTNPKKQLIIAEDFNLFFDSKLDAQGGNPTIKKKPLAKLIELKENYDSCNIWRVRNTKCKRFSFPQKHSSDFIQLRLDYMFILNTLQEYVTMTDVDSYFNRSFSCTVISFKRKVLSQR